MKVSKYWIHLPPELSASWRNIVSICRKGTVLVFALDNGSSVEVDHLSQEEMKAIFNARQEYLEELAMETLADPQGETGPLFQEKAQVEPLFSNAALRFGIGSFDSLGMALQHNPEQADSPPLPSDVLKKISAIAKVISPDEISQMPKGEPHCHCFYCQIAKAIHGLQEEELDIERIEREGEEAIANETVADEELHFQQWEIAQTSDKLFAVTNRLDKNEKYSVYLGSPVGCTCGHNGCEHILAVLKS